MKAILNLHKEAEEEEEEKSENCVDDLNSVQAGGQTDLWQGQTVIFDSSSAICVTYVARAYFPKLI